MTAARPRYRIDDRAYRLALIDTRPAPTGDPLVDRGHAMLGGRARVVFTDDGADEETWRRRQEWLEGVCDELNREGER